LTPQARTPHRTARLPNRERHHPRRRRLRGVAIAPAGDVVVLDMTGFVSCWCRASGLSHPSRLAGRMAGFLTHAGGRDDPGGRRRSSHQEV
jgi:hypothetical protein